MLQLLGQLVDRFRHNRQPALQNSAVTDWGHLIYSYVTQLFGTSFSIDRDDRARREIEGRGLAFGQIKVLGGSPGSVKLGLTDKQKLTADVVRSALIYTLKKRSLDKRIEVKDGNFSGQIRVDFIDPSDNTFTGACWSGFRNGQSASWKEFMSISCWDDGGLYEAEAHSDEAIRVFIQVAEELGFNVGSKHYAHETPVRIEDIVVYASRWEDPKSGCRYLDVLWHPNLVKHHIWHGSNRSDRRTEGQFEGEVLACTRNGDWWPKITINNKPVYSTIIKSPTEPMLRAKSKFIIDSRHKCAVCNDPATQQVRLVRFEIEDGLGGFSSGGISYTCNKETCLDIVKDQKCVRAEVSPYQPEIWN